jgi:hypothetical protein
MVLTRLRAYIGFLTVRHTLPNSTHHALATLQHAGAVSSIITQNVDGLHHAALRPILPECEVNKRILELHGNIFVSPLVYVSRFPPPSDLSPRGTAHFPLNFPGGFFFLFSETPEVSY